MPRVAWKDLARYSVAIPPEPILQAFDRAVRPMLSMVEANVVQSRALAATRDALLPKLLSGEIRVSEAERLVEAAV